MVGSMTRKLAWGVYIVDSGAARFVNVSAVRRARRLVDIHGNGRYNLPWGWARRGCWCRSWTGRRCWSRRRRRVRPGQVENQFQRVMVVTPWPAASVAGNHDAIPIAANLIGARVIRVRLAYNIIDKR